MIRQRAFLPSCDHVILKSGSVMQAALWRDVAVYWVSGSLTDCRPVLP